MNLIGDVEGRTAIMVDDMVDTAGTLLRSQRPQRAWRDKSRRLLHARRIIWQGTRNVRNSELDELVVTDTIPLSDEAKSVKKIRQLTIADLLAESIRRVSNEESISALFDS